MKYEVRLNGIGDSKARVVKATSEKKAVAQVKEMLGIPVEQPCYYMCRKLKNKKILKNPLTNNKKYAIINTEIKKRGF